MKHKATNRISKLIVEDKILLNEDDIRDEAVSFFYQLLTGSKEIDYTQQQDLVDIIPKIFNPNQNKALSAIPSTGKIKKVVLSFQGDKALGPDGFPMFFFQEFWHIVGKDTINAVKEFFGSRRILKEINSTFIALIPKLVGADSMGKFRPTKSM